MRMCGFWFSFARIFFLTSSIFIGSASALSWMCTEMPFDMPRPGIAGGMNTCHFGSGMAESMACILPTSMAACCSGNGRLSHPFRSMISVVWFSPRPPIMPQPVMERTLSTSGSVRRISTARRAVSRLRSRAVPSGISIDANTTRWSSSGRKAVCVFVKSETVSRTISISNTPARKMRLASHFAAVTNRPLNLSTHQLNQASGPCLYGRASRRMDAPRAG